jgi:hypothetical protein
MWLGITIRLLKEANERGEGGRMERGININNVT